ncbi:MAG: helix-turn-helix domain-containing protein [Leptospirillia bacterium]
MKTLGLKEAANALLLAPESLRQLAASGRIPGARIGKRWVFLEEDLKEFIRSRYTKKRQALESLEAKKCYTNEARRGGSISPPRAVTALDNRLKQLTGEPPKSITTV